MDAVIQVEASELRTGVTFSEVTVVWGQTIVSSSTWVTVLSNVLEIIKKSININAPNNVRAYS